MKLYPESSRSLYVIRYAGSLLYKAILNFTRMDFVTLVQFLCPEVPDGMDSKVGLDSEQLPHILTVPELNEITYQTGAQTPLVIHHARPARYCQPLRVSQLHILE